ncbi:MAG TPA: fused MFS/spermidine synthase [Stackebrandtia sp.]|jgi:SAM-dependent methyltransferase|uniref:spermidine synthase n=1 Tax=Stackebrandtia sp. TaxID=2023065 RepID=UPI002D5C32D5|nr:fused MFS/spermidine synthase [Stackebrandtia sp.]HZE37609.1 fused MFS/spermidine synthase [Stackebrandtia sp.]
MRTYVAPSDDNPDIMMLVVGDTVQSSVDLSDPTHLVDEYTQHLSILLDVAAPSRRPLRVLHLGAGGLALARYVAATRPGSYQQAVDIDADVVEQVRRLAPLARGVRVKVRIGDAREQLAAAPDDCYDVIVADVFSGPFVPAHLTTVEFLAQVARVLRPGGCFGANVCDRRSSLFSRGMAAAVGEVFADAAVLSEPGVLNGRRFGNVLLFGAAGGLPVAEIQRRCAGSTFPYRVLHGREFERFLGGTPATTDATAVRSPEPPPSLFSPRS